MRCVFPLLLAAAAAQGQPADTVYRIGNGVSAPNVLSKVDPEYTREARKANLEGSVLLSMVVGRDGLAHDIKVVNGLGSGLDEEAIRAAKKWRFVPGQKNDEPVSVQATIEMKFTLLHNPPMASAKVIPVDLAPPQLVSPNDGAKFDHVPRTVNFQWGSRHRARQATSSNGTMPMRTGVIPTSLPVTTNSAKIEFVGAQEGRWRVWPVNEDGERGAASEWRTFRFTR